MTTNKVHDIELLIENDKFIRILLRNISERYCWFSTFSSTSFPRYIIPQHLNPSSRHPRIHPRSIVKAFGLSIQRPKIVEYWGIRHGDASDSDFESERDNVSNDEEVDEERMKKSFQEVWDCGTNQWNRGIWLRGRRRRICWKFGHRTKTLQPSNIIEERDVE